MGIKLDVSPQDLQMVLALLKQYLPNTQVWAFGSRVKFTAHPASDLDLATFISPNQEIQLSLLEEALAESNISFRVDLHNWHELPQSFHENIRSNYIEIQSNNSIETPMSGRYEEKS